MFEKIKQILIILKTDFINRNVKIDYTQFDYMSKSEAEKELQKIFFGKKIENKFLNAKKIDGEIYPNELIFLNHLKDRPVDESLNTYWYFDMLILDEDKIKRKLLSKEYLVIDNKKEDTLNLMTIDQLEQILSKAGYAFYGSKEELKEQIISLDIKIDTLYVFKLTKKGEKVISENLGYINSKNR